MNIQHLLGPTLKDSTKFWEPFDKGQFTSNMFVPTTSVHLTIDKEPPTAYPDLSNDSNMICPLCKKVFRFEKNLLRHMQKTHATGEAESVLKCKLCNYTTRHYSNMYVHIRTHTGDKPYSCAGCGASFTQGSSLKLHIKSRHDDNSALFSLTKKPGKNSLTKLWTRVYKKNRAKFGNYGFGNYFSSFTVPHGSNNVNHDFLTPFSNFPSLTAISHFARNSACMPLIFNRLPILKTNSLNKFETESNALTRPKKAILSVSTFVTDHDKEPEKTTSTKIEMKEYSENVSDILSDGDMESEEIKENSVSFTDPLLDMIKSNLRKHNHITHTDQSYQLIHSLTPDVMHILKSVYANPLLDRECSNLPAQINRLRFGPMLQNHNTNPALLNTITTPSPPTWHEWLTKSYDARENSFLQFHSPTNKSAISPVPTIPFSSTNAMLGFSGYSSFMKMMGTPSKPFLS